MKRQWQVRRRVLPRVDGQLRWDRAYPLLVDWTTPSAVARCQTDGVRALADADVSSDEDEEVPHAYRQRCARLDATASPAADE